MEDKKTFSEISDKVEKILEQITSDSNEIIFEDTHNTTLKYLFENNRNRFKKNFKSTFRNEILLNILENGELKYPIKGFDTCYNCGQLVNLYFDGKRIYNEEDKKPCFSEKVFSFDINVPSGKFLFAD